mmetsp:Transcript_22662/g.70381  ORF Transcript_22662/g.70381 Transcript_22662/m.70381 type:complete len:211 (-) Transcript_22662:415-1047(-)
MSLNPYAVLLSHPSVIDSTSQSRYRCSKGFLRVTTSTSLRSTLYPSSRNSLRIWNLSPDTAWLVPTSFCASGISTRFLKTGVPRARIAVTVSSSSATTRWFFTPACSTPLSHVSSIPSGPARLMLDIAIITSPFTATLARSAARSGFASTASGCGSMVGRVASMPCRHSGPSSRGATLGHLTSALRSISTACSCCTTSAFSRSASWCRFL